MHTPTKKRFGSHPKIKAGRQLAVPTGREKEHPKDKELSRRATKRHSSRQKQSFLLQNANYYLHIKYFSKKETARDVGR